MPGHNPEHISLLVRDRSRGEEPLMLLSGVALLVADVARADLLGDEAEKRSNARVMCRTLDDSHFIFTEATDFEEPDLNLSSIPETDGTTILCVNNACTEDHLRKMGHSPAGPSADKGTRRPRALTTPGPVRDAAS